MAVEALRQLGNSTVYSTSTLIETKTSHDLPLLPCTYCDLQFRTTSDLNNHLSICKNNLYKCQICNETFDKKVDFNNHLVCHAVVRPHSCRICSTLFVNKKDLLQHMSIHGTSININTCQICSLTFNRSSSLTNHMKIHSYQPGRAIITSISKSTETTAKLVTVLSDEDNNGDTSITLGKPVSPKKIVLPSISNLAPLNNWNLYYEDFQSDVKLDIAQDITIEDPLDSMDCKDVYQIAQNKEDEIKVDNLGTPISLPTQQNKKPHTCVYCRKNFAREKALASHLKLHADVLHNYYQCENCDSSFTDEISLSKHLLTCMHRTKSNIYNEEPHKIETKTKENGAEIVNEIVPIIKGKGTKHGCTDCNKIFTTKQKLYRHMWIHRKRIHSCETCSVNFEKQEDLDAHRLSSHLGSSPYICSECGKSFSSRQGLWEHSRIHGADSYLYRCGECDKTFTSRQGYLIHKRKHNDERPYGCRFCWKAFRDGGTLRKHERIHTGERPHACPICAKAFNQKVVLREHIRWLHTANKQPNIDGFFECTLCEIVFTEKDELCAHIVKHSDQMAILAKDASRNNIQARTEVVSSKPTKSVKSKVVQSNTESKEVLDYIPEIIIEEQCVNECDMCGVTFLSKHELAEHVHIHI